jgi:hypothetical protein
VHIVPHSIDEKKVPSLEPLLEDCHLSKPAPRASARNKDSCRGLCFYKDMRAHLNSTPKLTSHVTKEPVLRYAEAGMLIESLNKQLSIPEGYSAMWKGGGTDPACKLTLDATEFVLEVLGPSDVCQLPFAHMSGEGCTHCWHRLPFDELGPTDLMVYPMHWTLPTSRSVTTGKFSGNAQSSSISNTFLNVLAA